MTEAKATIDIRVYDVPKGEACGALKCCRPLYQALGSTAMVHLDEADLNQTGKKVRAIMLPAEGQGQFIVMRFCPFCGTNFETDLPRYLSWGEKLPLGTEPAPSGGALHP